MLQNPNPEVYKIDYWCFLSGEMPAESKDTFAEHSIKRVCNCTKHVPNYFYAGELPSDDDIVYHRAPLGFATDDNFVEMVEEAMQFIQQGRAKNEYVLVHCTNGVSIAATLLTAFLMRHQSMELGDALVAIKNGVNGCPGWTGICPSSQMLQKLVKYEESLYSKAHRASFRAQPDPWWHGCKRGGEGMLGIGTSLAMPKWKRDEAEKPVREELFKVREDGEEYAMHTAVMRKEYKMVRHMIVNMKMSVETYNAKQATPLFLAAQDGSLEMAKILINEGKANVENGILNGLSPMFAAAQNGHVEFMKYLCRECGAQSDPPASDKSSVTPLFYACKEGRLEAVQFLVKRGANPNRQLEDGTCPIFIACEYGQLDVVRYLIRSLKVDVEVPRNDGKTALRVASENGHVQVLRSLVVDGSASWERLSDQSIGMLSKWPKRDGYDQGVQIYQRTSTEIYGAPKN